MIQFKINYLLIIAVVDVILSLLLMLTLNINGVTGPITMLILIFLNTILSAFLKVFDRNFLIYANINIILLPAIFFVFTLLQVHHQNALKFDLKRFSIGVTKYEMDINIKHNTFSIYRVIGSDNNSLQGLIQGSILRFNDTIYVLDKKSNHRIFIYKDKLVGYPNLTDTIVIKDYFP